MHCSECGEAIVDERGGGCSGEEGVQAGDARASERGDNGALETGCSCSSAGQRRVSTAED